MMPVAGIAHSFPQRLITATFNIAKMKILVLINSLAKVKVMEVGLRKRQMLVNIAVNKQIISFTGSVSSKLNARLYGVK